MSGYYGTSDHVDFRKFWGLYEAASESSLYCKL